MAEKSSFVLYDRYYEQINMLSDEQAGQLFKAIYANRSGEEIAISDPAVAILWSVIRQQMDIDDRKYQEVCDKRKSAGQKGGRPAKTANGSEEKQNEASQPKDLTEDSKETNGYFEKQTKANKPNAFLGFENNPDNDIDIECDIDNEKNNTPLISPQGEVKAKQTRHKYGQYKNVLLSDGDLDKLKAEYPTDWQTRIERLSEYMASTGKTYKNHLATIRAWARKDKDRSPTAGSAKKPDDGLDDLLAQMYQRGWE